jgi:MoaA/NifB/PqqE/SkfB family radical SAM enzyme
MAEPQSQIEVQLGHFCNNRCVFCVSGQLTEQKRAPQLPQGPIRDQIERARQQGAQKITFLGGEPTLQQSFLDLLALAVALEFPEIVIFTNGVMTPKESFRERAFRVLDGLGPDMKRRVIWRFSLQGGTQAAHDATTLNPGAWGKIQTSLAALKADGARLTCNLCVVESNYRSVPALAEEAVRWGFESLHLDMVRPRDAGDRTEFELRAMMARYTDMVPAFTALSDACLRLRGPGFDLNLGNLPYCVAPHLAHHIHHDGQQTLTVAADGQGHTQDGFDKYLDKRSDKHKPTTCAQCVFEPRCSGVFDKYREFHGDAEFVPVSAEQLWQSDTRGHHFVLLAEAAMQNLARAGVLRVARVDEAAGVIEVAVPTAGSEWRVRLRRAGQQVPADEVAGIAGKRLAAGLLLPLVEGPRARTVLLAALDRAAEAVGDPFFDGDERRRWLAHLAHQTEHQRSADIHIRGLCASLRSISLAGLRPTGVHCAPHGHGFRLHYESSAGSQGSAGSLMLTVAAAPDASGHWRPRFLHEAKGLAEATVATFSQELGQTLRRLRRVGDRDGTLLKARG